MRQHTLLAAGASERNLLHLTTACNPVAARRTFRAAAGGRPQCNFALYAWPDTGRHLHV